MRPVFLKKLTSLFIIVMVLAVSGHGICLENQATEQLPALSAGTGCDAPADQCPACPACPVDEHSDADHDAASCFCSCHLPLTVQAVQIRHSPVITVLVFFEPFTAIPEVYLPKFIPPQNLT